MKLRADFLLHQYRGKEEVTLTLFDVTSGYNKQLVVDRQGRQAEKDRGLNFKRVTRASYGKREDGSIRFKDFQPDVMSIVDVYDFIEELGDAENAKSLHELSVFSHAFVDGPILVNSTDDQRARNPDGSLS